MFILLKNWCKMAIQISAIVTIAITDEAKVSMSTSLIPKYKKLLNVIRNVQRTVEAQKPRRQLSPSEKKARAARKKKKAVPFSPTAKPLPSPLPPPLPVIQTAPSPTFSRGSLPGDLLLASTSASVLSSILNNNPSARGFLQGYIAEEYLMTYLRNLPGISDVSKIPDRHSKRGDIAFNYESRHYTVEVKSLKSNSRKEEFLDGGFSGVVGVKKTDVAWSKAGVKGTCHLSPGEFDILAISTYNVTGNWGFYFLASEFIPRTEGDPSKIKTSFRVNALTTPCLYQDIFKVIEKVTTLN